MMSDELLDWMLREQYFDLQLLLWQIRELHFNVTIVDARNELIQKSYLVERAGREVTNG